MPVLLSLRFSARDAGRPRVGRRRAPPVMWAAVMPLKARLGRKGRQLELVRSTGSVLSVEVIESLRDLDGIDHQLRVLLGARQGPSPWRINGAVDDDVGHVYAVLGVFLRQHLRQRTHHHTRIVQRLAGLTLTTA